MARGRRRSSRSRMAGIFTRSRSEIFVHRTRSGRGRPDPARRKGIPSQTLIPPKTEPLAPGAAIAGAAAICTSIKDLRARRVFSPSSATIECSPSKPDKVVPCNDRMDVGDGFEVREVEKSIDGPIDAGLENGVGILNGSEGQGEEERVQTTPPDSDLLRKIDGGDVNVAPVSEVEVREQASEASGDALHAADAVPHQPEPSSANPSKFMPGITQRVRTKIYQNSSSLAYRRLLPYLMDLEKERSSAPLILPCRNVPVKVEKILEERSLLLNANPSAEGKDNCIISEDHPVAESRSCVDYVKTSIPEITKPLSPIKFINTAMELPSAASNATIDSPESIVPESSRPCSLVVNDRPLIESPKRSTDGLLNDHKASSNPIKRNDDEFELLCNTSYCPPSYSGSPTVEELKGDVKALQSLPRKVEKGIRTPSSTIEMNRKPHSGSSKHGHFIQKGNHVLAPRKGILKTRTRGCKGLCVCLNCSSFRLHAERGYEFSRKQMQEADDIVVGLVKELSCLRNIIENSDVPTDSAARNREEQLKGACDRALRVEEASKSRLKQMYQELHFHCRVPGPRVTFAEESSFSGSKINMNI